MIVSAKLPDTQVCRVSGMSAAPRCTLALARMLGEMAQKTRVRVDVLSARSARLARSDRTGDDDLHLRE